MIAICIIAAFFILSFEARHWIYTIAKISQMNIEVDEANEDANEDEDEIPESLKHLYI